MPHIAYGVNAGAATRMVLVGLVNATHSRSYPFRPNPQDAALLQNLSARLAAYCDPKDGRTRLKEKIIWRHVRNLHDKPLESFHASLMLNSPIHFPGIDIRARHQACATGYADSRR